MKTTRAIEVYLGSDGESTKQFYAVLLARGAAGDIAMNLFRAQKASERAKVYRGGARGRGSFKSLAYDKKTWSMKNLCRVLTWRGAELGIRFGWKEDPETLFGERASWVLYVDLPTGQVSFHAPVRGDGPDYPGEWDQQRGMSVQRVLDYAEAVFRGSPAEPSIPAPAQESLCL